MASIRPGDRKAPLRRRRGRATVFVCAAGLLIGVAGLSGCGSNGSGNSGQNGSQSSASSSPSSSPSCATSGFIHRSGLLRVGQQPFLVAAMVPAAIIPLPDFDADLDGLRPAGDEEQEQEGWAHDGLNNASANPESRVANSSPATETDLGQESDAVAEEEEVNLWTDDLTAQADFGDDVCSDLDGLANNLEQLDSLNASLADFSQVCNGYIQQQQSNNDSTAANDVCMVIQDANNKFEEAFPCNDLQVTEWLVDWLESVFCHTGEPSG